jgi:hypothetical protein
VEIYRVPPYPITTKWDLPIPNYTYKLYLEDLVDHSTELFTVTSDVNGQVSYELPITKVQFDRSFLIRFYDTELEHVLYESNLDIVRPYVDVNKLATTASEIAEYKMNELIARSIIDTQVGNGFYNHKLIMQGIGQGTDYYPLWEHAYRVLKVYENNVLVYDLDAEDPETNVHQYKINLDNSAIYRVDASAITTESYNRTESYPLNTMTGSGDLLPIGGRTVHFPYGYEYTFILDAGYKTIPPDIERATLMLIEDLKCGKLEYFKRYMTSYNTDQFRIQFDKGMFDGTGNFIVDKILEKYENNITRPGVL